MHSKRTIHNSIAFIMTLAVLLLIYSMVLGHKNKPHTANDSTLIDTNSSSYNDSVTSNIDSIYTLVQEGYQNLQPLFQRACYDCHSNQTKYPWYYKLPVIKGMIDDDITEARKHLDLSTGFPFAGHGEPAEDLEAIQEVIDKGEMPPFKYKMLHWNAGFSDMERDAISSWITKSLQQITEYKKLFSSPDSMATPLEETNYEK